MEAMQQKEGGDHLSAYNALSVPANTGSTAAAAAAAGTDQEKNFALVLDLMDPATREQALIGLSKKRETYDDLAPILWHSFGMCSVFAVKNG